MKKKMYAMISVGVVSALALTFGMSAKVFADPTGGPTVDPTATGSLTITKLLGQDTPGAADGTQIPVASNGGLPAGYQTSDLIDGVTFEICLVMDLSTPQADWAQAEDLMTNATAATAAALPCQGPAVSGTTGSTGYTPGVITFSDLTVGVYLVKETAQPARVVPTTPFLVSIPTANPNPNYEGTDNWIYDVYAYPKNDMITIAKSVQLSSYDVSQDITYTITTRVPSAGNINDVSIRDDLVYFGFDPATVWFSDNRGTGESIMVGTTSFTRDDTLAGNNTFKWDSTSGDITFKSDASHNGEKITIKVTANLGPDAPDNGYVDNTAYVCADSSCDLNDPQGSDMYAQSNTISFNYGAVNLMKTDTANNPLAGAVFAVYDGPCENIDLATATPIKVSAPTDDTGMTRIAGLLWSSFDLNGNDLDPDHYHSYCFAETQAPAGYKLTTATKEYDLLALTLKQTPTFIDEKANTPILPITGGYVSVAAFATYIAGALLIGGMVLMVVRKRRQEAAV